MRLQKFRARRHLDMRSKQHIDINPYLPQIRAPHYFPRPYLRPAFIHPVKHVSMRQKSLTTIIAVRCLDGLIMVADTQATVGAIKERVSKFYPIGKAGEKKKEALIGCAGTRNYIDVFVKRYITPAIIGMSSGDYYDFLQNAIWSYNEYARKAIDGFPSIFDNDQISGDVYPSGLFGVYDKYQERYRLFELTPPHPPRELDIDQQDRAVVGMGEVYAPLLFTQLERLLRKIYTEKVWSKLSTNLVAKIAYLIMERVIAYDLYTGGEPIVYRIDENGVELFKKSEIFTKGKEGKSHLAEAIELAIKEIGGGNLIELAGKLHFNLDSIKPIFGRSSS